MNLKRMCSLKGLDFKMLSKKTGISLTYLYELQKGKKKNPTKETLEKLSNALEIPITELLYENLKEAKENRGEN